MKKQLKNEEEKRFITMPIKFKVRTNQMGIYLELPTDTKKALGLIKKPKSEIKFKDIKFGKEFVGYKIKKLMRSHPTNKNVSIVLGNKNKVLKYKKVNIPKNYILRDIIFNEKCPRFGVMTFLPKRKRMRYDIFKLLNILKSKKDITMLRGNRVRTLKSPYTPKQVRNFLYKD